MHTHPYTWHLISSQNYFPNFYICTRESSRPQAESLHHAHWMPQLTTVTAGHPQPPQQQDAKLPIYSRTTKPLSYLPSPPSFPPHHTKHLTCSFSQQCPPHTGEPRHPNTRVPANSSRDWASKIQSLQETFSWASPKQRINF